MGMTIDEEVRQIKEQLANVSTKYRMMQANYNARLKADMVAMLTEIQLEIEETDSGCGWDGYIKKDVINDYFQQKINLLKEK